MRQYRIASFFVLVLGLFFMGDQAAAQVVPAADAGGSKIWAGATVSGFKVDYGDRKLGGFAAFADLDTNRGTGIEAEARWLEINQNSKLPIDIETYSVGVRYHRNMGKFQPYGKFLAGIGDFTYPNHYAHGRYAVLTMGGGVDYQWKRRISIRAADFEYQKWPDFTFGSLSPVGLSCGVRFRVH